MERKTGWSLGGYVGVVGRLAGHYYMVPVCWFVRF